MDTNQTPQQDGDRWSVTDQNGQKKYFDSQQEAQDWLDQQSQTRAGSGGSGGQSSGGQK